MKVNSFIFLLLKLALTAEVNEWQRTTTNTPNIFDIRRLDERRKIKN